MRACVRRLSGRRTKSSRNGVEQNLAWKEGKVVGYLQGLGKGGQMALAGDGEISASIC